MYFCFRSETSEIRISVRRSLIAACILSQTACASLWEQGDVPEPPRVVSQSRPHGDPISRRVHRRAGRLGPQGGLLGLKARFEYPGVPLVYHPEVRSFVGYYTERRRSFIEEALNRRARYLPIMEEVFRRYGLPLELLNLAFVESRFVADARCADGSTVGLWQLSKSTAKNYGLKVGGMVDERTDVRKSTEAAARFLASLYDTFGDWYLAAAAYNAGPMRVQKAVDRAGMDPAMDTLDVFELTSRGILSNITRDFVAKFGALVIVTRDLSRYGFREPERTPPSGDAPTKKMRSMDRARN